MSSSSPFSVAALTRRRPLTPVHSFVNKSSDTFTTATQTAHHDDDANADAQQQKLLQRTLGLGDIIFYGVGCSVGAGIYSLVGIGAKLAGPSIALSFLVCGVACCFTSLSYAEFASRVPLAGSAYTFTYVSFGELCGWLVGWNLTLGYAVSAAVVARSWAEYLVGFIVGFLGESSGTTTTWWTHMPLPLFFTENYTCCPLAMVIIGICTIVLVTGAKESTRFNMFMTLLNLSVLGFVLVAGTVTGSVSRDNLTPVFPHGLEGTARGAGLVFFAYLGFDMVSCLGEEVQNPERNMPIGIIGSLLVSMTIYVSVSVVVVGMAPVELLGQAVPIIHALLANACCTHEEQLERDAVAAAETCLDYSCAPVLHPLLYTGSRLVSFGAIFGLTTATFACLMGQPRIFYSMAQDGLLWKIYARVHPKTGVPTIGTILTGVFTALVACLVDLESLANAISLGTLQVFTFVNAGVLILRMRPPAMVNEQDSLLEEEEHTPLVEQEDVPVARSLGLVKQTSSQIKSSLRNAIASPSTWAALQSVHDNGSKPHWLVLGFTLSVLVASMAFSHEWAGFGLIFVLLMLVATACAVGLYMLPKSPPPDTFACPMVPAVPLMGIVCNSYMMGSMPLSTWTVILTWLLGGLLFYFGYGIHHSELRTNNHGSDESHHAVLTEMSPASTKTSLLREKRAASEQGYNSIHCMENQ